MGEAKGGILSDGRSIQPEQSVTNQEATERELEMIS